MDFIRQLAQDSPSLKRRRKRLASIFDRPLASADARQHERYPRGQKDPVHEDALVRAQREAAEARRAANEKRAELERARAK